MQYPMTPRPSSRGLPKQAKIGIGVGASVAAIIIGVLLFFLIRKIREHKGVRRELRDLSVESRFGGSVDTTYVGRRSVPFPPSTVESVSERSRTIGGAKYTGVPTGTPAGQF
jgi:hypothetical protein